MSLHNNEKILERNQFVFMLFYIFAIIVIPRTLKHISDSSLILWVQLFSYIVLGIGSFFVFRELYVDSKNQWKESVIKGAITLVIVFFLDILLTNISMIPSGLLYPDYISANEDSIGKASNLISNKMVLVASLGVLGPITEEVVFRGILTGKLSKKLPKWFCVMLSSLLFMLPHIHAFSIPDILYNMHTLATGIVFSIAYLKSGNLTICMILHILNNLQGLLL